MKPVIQEIQTAHSPESLLDLVAESPGAVLLRSSGFDWPQARYSFLAMMPFLTFRSFGSRCEITDHDPKRGKPQTQTQFGNPWHVLDSLMSRYELLDEIDLPFPLGGCFGYWGYDLKNFTEPKLPRRAANDLELPDCHVGFYDALVVFDHHLGKVWIVSTGLRADGSRSQWRADVMQSAWNAAITAMVIEPSTQARSDSEIKNKKILSNFTRADFLDAVTRAKKYIQSGDIYQVNLAQRLSTLCDISGWELFQRLISVSPSPFAAYLNCGEFQVASSSPELFPALERREHPDAPDQGHTPAFRRRHARRATRL